MGKSESDVSALAMDAAVKRCARATAEYLWPGADGKYTIRSTRFDAGSSAYMISVWSSRVHACVRTAKKEDGTVMGIVEQIVDDEGHTADTGTYSQQLCAMFDVIEEGGTLRYGFVCACVPPETEPVAAADAPAVHV